MNEGRSQYVRRAVSAALALGVGGVALMASPAEAKPDVATVKAQVDQLNQQAEVASERYDLVAGQASDAQSILNALNADLANEQAAAQGLRDQVASIVVSQYQGQNLSAASQVALSNDPSSFLQGLGAVTAYNNQRGQLLSVYSDELNRIDMRRKAVSQEQGTLDSLQAQLAQAKSQADQAAAAAQKQLNSLDVKTRAVVVQQLAPGAAPVGQTFNAGPVSGNASTAVSYALAQVGKAYVHGAAGPNAFDCSGLTMAAWAAAGVGLPHNAAAQKSATTPVSESDLQPGDLVFYYPDRGISHVGMYVGNGMVVSALNPSEGIRVHPLHMMPYAGAGRVG